ncbi:inositol monophosphatase, partial [Streptomyces sp. NPDC024062]
MIDDFLYGTAGHAGATAEVERAVRAAAAAEILPRYRQLAAHEIVEKSGPHDLVTAADRLAEEHHT